MKDKIMIDNLVCPACKVSLLLEEEYLKCLTCSKKYPVIDGIPVFIEDLNAEQMKNKLYTDRLTKKAQNKVTLSKDCYEQLHQIMIKLFGSDVKFKKVLDLGCGNGFLSLHLLKYDNFAEEIYGLDISWHTLKAFDDNMQENKISQKTFLLCATARRNFLPDDYFDAVICHKFIHHVPLEPTLDEVRRVLKKDGVFICFKEPYLNYLLTYFRRIYSTLINFVSFSINKIRNQNYNSDILCRRDTKKFLYSKKTIENMAKEKGFDPAGFYFSTVMLPFVNMLIHPFKLKFPKLKVYFDCLLKLVTKIDTGILEKIIPKRFFQEASFYLRKK